MAATPSSARVFILIDPVQDYEESTQILGVYRSLATAKYATPRLVKPTLRWEPNRFAEVQEWHGDTLVKAWTHRPGHGWRERAI